MENNERDRKLDQWLDEALSQYSAAEPRLGLEKRVLAQVAAEQSARTGRRSFWRWMPAFAAIAAVLIVMVAVRPYWEAEKTRTPAKFSPTEAAPKTTAETTTPQTTNLSEENRSVTFAAKKAAPNQVASGRAKQETPVLDALASKDAEPKNLPSANTARATVTLPAAAPVNSKFTDSSSATSTKERDKGSVAGPELRILTANAPAPPAPAPLQKTGAAVGGISADVSASAPAQVRHAEAAYTAPVRIDAAGANASEQTAEARSGIIATEKVAVMPPVSTNQMKAMKAKPVGALAKKLEETVDTVDVVGMPTLRTNLKNVPPGPIQQFPSPAPLSEQEKLMLAVAKQMKNKPSNEDKQDTSDGQLKNIEIKSIEIAPLPGPPK